MHENKNLAEMERTCTSRSSVNIDGSHAYYDYSLFHSGIMVKPDGVQRRLVGNVISRFEAKGFVLLGLKLTVPTIAMVEEHYEAHKHQPYFKKIVDFMTCGPVVVMVGMLL